MVLERLDRVARHRVDGVGPDQLLDVEHVAVLGVLGRGRRPQAALRRRALGGQRVPVVAREDLLVGLVGELGVGDRELALELGVAADLVEPLVGLGVDARDEERGDRRDPARVAAALDEPLEAADVGLGDRAVALEREDQRHVDGDAARDRLLDRRQALERGGDLHEQVRAVDELVTAASPPRSCPRCRGRGSGRPRARPSRRCRPSWTGSSTSQAAWMSRTASARKISFGSLSVCEHLAELLVVGVALGDRALEDGGVRGDAVDALVDQRRRARRPR